MLRVSQVGGRGGGVRYLGQRPKYGCFFLNEPSLTYVYIY